jgi:hypothetical protein
VIKIEQEAAELAENYRFPPLPLCPPVQIGATVKLFLLGIEQETAEIAENCVFFSASSAFSCSDRAAVRHFYLED